jgi:hypothetical protein
VPSTCVKRWKRMAPFGPILVAVASFTLSSQAALRCVHPLRQSVRPRKVWRGAELNRALRLLAGSPHGCTEAIMLAHGFTDEILGRLVMNGLATAAPGIKYAGNRPIEVTRLAITDAGRQAIDT